MGFLGGLKNCCMHCEGVNWLVKCFGKQLIVLYGGLLKSCDFGEFFFEPIGDEKIGEKFDNKF